MLSPDERKEFHGALLNAFPEYTDLEIMVSFELSQNLNEIVQESKLKNVVFKLIQWAETYGRLEDLIRGAYKYNTGNPKLKAFYQKKFPIAPDNSNEQTQQQEFDVFLCYNSQDKSQVEEIARELIKRGFRPWLDEWELRPGLSWQRELERQIANIKSAAVFIGSSGLGPWQNQEIDAFLREFVNRGCPVIPVLLPTAPQKPELPIFLQGNMWVDFRQEEPDPMRQLIWGITGRKPSDRDTSTHEIQLKTFKFQTQTVNRRGEIIKREPKTVQYFTENLPNNITLDMVYIPDGRFMMGTADEEVERLIEKFGSGEYFTWEQPQHEVTLTSFFMGKYPVTQAQWKAVANLPQIEKELKPEPSRFKGDILPVERVSWYDAVEFCNRLSNYTGREYRLPSEAEWEYACRAETTTPFHFGETITHKLANYNARKTFADEPQGDYRAKITPVGTFPHNAFSLYDMHGNVWEWCADEWHKSYEDAPIDGSAWLGNETNKSIARVLRGGSCGYNPLGCRCAYRDWVAPDIVNHYYGGFRVVSSVSPREVS